MTAPSSKRSAWRCSRWAWLSSFPAPWETARRPLLRPSALKQLSVEELMDIEVTSVSKRPEKLADAASAIQVITGDDIASSGATSIPEALRLASNLEVAQIDSRQWAITARGFNNVFADKMLVLIDGRSVYTPLYAGVYWDVQDTLLEDLDRIEVISGPGATQWGSNAVNGVINITTKSAKDTQGGLLEGGGGTELLGFGGGALRRRAGARRLFPGLREVFRPRRVGDSQRPERGRRLADGPGRVSGGLGQVGGRPPHAAGGPLQRQRHRSPAQATSASTAATCSAAGRARSPKIPTSSFRFTTTAPTG